MQYVFAAKRKSGERIAYAGEVTYEVDNGQDGNHVLICPRRRDDAMSLIDLMTSVSNSDEIVNWSAKALAAIAPVETAELRKAIQENRDIDAKRKALTDRIKANYVNSKH